MSQWSAQQRRVINAEGVTLLGVDARGRPVVAQETGIPKQRREWALLRSGEPADVTPPVRPA